jgi:hypothetical protein
MSTVRSPLIYARLRRWAPYLVALIVPGGAIVPLLHWLYRRTHERT